MKEGKVTTVIATPGGSSGTERSQEVSYTDTRVIGNGSFGVVYMARLVDSNEQVAIKKVLQDKRFKVPFEIIILIYFWFLNLFMEIKIMKLLQFFDGKSLKSIKTWFRIMGLFSLKLLLMIEKL